MLYTYSFLYVYPMCMAIFLIWFLLCLSVFPGSFVPCLPYSISIFVSALAIVLFGGFHIYFSIMLIFDSF